MFAVVATSLAAAESVASPIWSRALNALLGGGRCRYPVNAA